MYNHFVVEADQVRRLAAGTEDASFVRMLRRGQLSRNLQLIAAMLDRLPASIAGRAATALITATQADDPAYAEWLLTTPTFSTWAGRCGAQLLLGTPSEVPIEVEASYLASIAAVAAARLGVETTLPLRVRDGVVVLPTLGAVRLDAAEHSQVRADVSAGRITVSSGDRQVVVPAGGAEANDGWLPLRTLNAEAGELSLSVALDDLDPWRACYKKQVAQRLPEAEVRQWEELLQQAWQLLADHAPRRAAELADGLRSMVPLSPEDAGPGLSATSGTAFAALGLTLSQRPEHLAATLIHEYQHSKLSALLTLLPMYDATDASLHFAPWRADPRPIGGLLQGAFAFLAVADFWLRLHHAQPHRALPLRMFAELRLQVDEVLTTLTVAKSLNETGREFVAAMRATLEPLLAEPLPPIVADGARRSLGSTRHAWQQRVGDDVSRPSPTTANAAG